VRLTIPFVEGAVALVLFVAPAVGLWLASAFLFALGLGIFLLLPAKRGTDCGCFGSAATSRIEPSLAIRNLSLSGLALLLSVVAYKGDIGGLRSVEVVCCLTAGAATLLLLEHRRVLRLASGEATSPKERE
jgi:hypothetical protein